MKTKRMLGLYGVVLCLLLSTLPTWAFYNPTTGRWLNRDPLEEQGGNNLQAFVGNNPITGYDSLGQHKGDIWPADVPVAFGEYVEMWKQAN